MSRIDWLKLLLAYPSPDGEPSPALDRQAIQRGLFLIETVLGISPRQSYRFVSDWYGPSSTDLLDDLEALVEAGSVERRGQAMSAVYAPSNELQMEAASLGRTLADPSTLSLVEVIRALLATLTGENTLAALYAAFPASGEKTALPDLLPGNPKAAHGDLATLFTPDELRERAEVVLSRRELQAGRYITLRPADGAHAG